MPSSLAQLKSPALVPECQKLKLLRLRHNCTDDKSRKKSGKTTMKRFNKLSIVVTALVAMALEPNSLQASERQLDAHEHGVSTLKLAQENYTILFELEAPGNDIVGFEHAPKNDDQRAAVKSALSRFKKPEAIFVLPAEAQCVASNQHVEYATGEDHAGFHVTWTMTCENPSKLQSMTTRFFSIFERAEEIEIEAIGNAGQASIDLEKGQSSVDLSNAVGD
jgi:hypothetical protein